VIALQHIFNVMNLSHVEVFNGVCLRIGPPKHEASWLLNNVGFAHVKVHQELDVILLLFSVNAGVAQVVDNLLAGVLVSLWSLRDVFVQILNCLDLIAVLRYDGGINRVCKLNSDVEFFLKVQHELHILLFEEEDVEAWLATPGCPAGAVHKGVKVPAAGLDDHVDVINVEASSSNIGSDEDVLGTTRSELV